MRNWMFIISVFLLAACDEVVYLRNDEKPVLVLNAVLEAGCDSMRIEVTETKGTYDKSPWRRFPEAEVRVYEEGELLGMAEYRDAEGAFVLMKRVMPERHYRVEARIPRKTSIWGETHVPEALLEVETELWYEHKDWGSPCRTVSYYWTDTPGKKNYYWFCSNEISGDKRWDNPSNWIETCLMECNSPLPDPFNQGVIIGEGEQGSRVLYDSYIRVVDTGMDGQSLELQYYPLASSYMGNGINLMAILLNVDKGLDAYLKSCIENKDHSQPPTDEIPWTYYHPAQVYSNIHGGTGIVGSYSSSVYVLYVAKDTVGLFGPGERVK